MRTVEHLEEAGRRPAATTYDRQMPTPAENRPVRGRAVVSSALAPVAMIGGWTLAASRQTGFDPVRETISALAAAPAVAPWIMTTGLAATGLCHLVTASGLRRVPAVGRLLLALGGAGTLAVAALPLDRWPQLHGAAATVAFGALSLWPAASWRRGGRGPVRPVAAAGASIVLVGLLAVFVIELQQLTPDGGAATGLAERLLAGAQSVWPLALVVTAGLTARRGASLSAVADPHSKGPSE